MDNQALFEAHLRDFPWKGETFEHISRKGGSISFTITSILGRLPLVWAGNPETIRSAIAVAVATAPNATHCYNHDLATAAGCTSRIPGESWALRWSSGPWSATWQWNVACDCLAFVITHYYTLQWLHYIITLAITRYYYVLYFYTVDTSLLHCLLLHTKTLLHIITWLLHDYCMIITSYVIITSLLHLYYIIVTFTIITLL